ncbi:MAG: response regulator transcription factor [Candidatus Dojkabacteria bacterium]|nr:response regulator transcription factor [Candidatus Dojkabacteria bacterium]
MNILIIENSVTLSHILQKTLDSYGYNTSLDNEIFVNRNLVKNSVFDFVIINTNLPKESTKTILNYIRKYSKNTKIIGVCNKGSWTEKVDFLNRGGDDVLTYPFPMQEILARIQSMIRRPKNYVDENLYVGNFMLDTKIKSVFRDNTDINLRKKEYELFEYLVRNKDRTISRCELLDHVWDYRQYVGSNTIDVHIKRLREKLENENIIQTIHGIGYQIKAPKAS